jgi:hypothetical protein
MLPSRILTLSIARPFREVYEFVAEPRNFAHWATRLDTGMVQLSETDWLVEFPEVGERVIRFSPRNPYGVADYQAFRRGQTPGPATPVRLYPNGEGTDLTLTRFQAEGVSQERFESECLWLQSDLARLKSLLEGR